LTSADASLVALSVPAFDLYNDADQRAFHDAVTNGDHGAAWTVREGLILRDGRVYVPESSAVLPDLLQLAHTVGHEGI
jgi:hypothetical protein